MGISSCQLISSGNSARNIASIFSCGRSVARSSCSRRHGAKPLSSPVRMSRIRLPDELDLGDQQRRLELGLDEEDPGEGRRQAGGHGVHGATSHLQRLQPHLEQPQHVVRRQRADQREGRLEVGEFLPGTLSSSLSQSIIFASPASVMA